VERITFGKGIRSIVLSPDGKVLTAHQDAADGVALSSITVWDVATGKITATHKGTNTGELAAEAVSPDGKTLALGVLPPPPANEFPLLLMGMDKPKAYLEAKLLNVGTGNETSICKMEVERAWPVLLAWNPDNRSLAIANGGNVQVWDTVAGKKFRTLATVKGVVGGNLTYSPNGRLLAAGTNAVLGGGIIGLGGHEIPAPATLWDPFNLKQFPIGEAAKHSIVAFGPNNLTLAIGRNDGVIGIVDLRNGRVWGDLKEHKGRVTGVAFTPNGQLLISAGDDAIRIWDVQKRVERASINKGGWRSLLLNADGSVLVGLRGGTVTVWDMPGQNAPRK
jgi:WD40 repeat protein